MILIRSKSIQHHSDRITWKYSSLAHTISSAQINKIFEKVFNEFEMLILMHFDALVPGWLDTDNDSHLPKMIIPVCWVGVRWQDMAGNVLNQNGSWQDTERILQITPHSFHFCLGSIMCWKGYLNHAAAQCMLHVWEQRGEDCGHVVKEQCRA